MLTNQNGFVTLFSGQTNQKQFRLACLEKGWLDVGFREHHTLSKAPRLE